MKRLQAVISKACQVFKAPENITVSSWADNYRKLSSENSAEAGQWKTSRTPYGTAWLYHIGVDVGKARIMGGLKVKEPGPRMCHFPKDRDRGYDSNFYRGLLSEAIVPNAKGEMHWEKIPGHERNEPLDCRNYANAAFRVLHPNLEYLKQRLENPDVKKAVPKRTHKKRKSEDDI